MPRKKMKDKPWLEWVDPVCRNCGERGRHLIAITLEGFVNREGRTYICKQKTTNGEQGE